MSETKPSPLSIDGKPLPIRPASAEFAAELADGPCSRCLKPIRDFRLPGEGMTAGYYVAAAWPQYAKPGEVYICDACMWADPRYIADYGPRVNALHDWFDPSREFPNLTPGSESCRACGVIRGKLSEAKPCPGPTPCEIEDWFRPVPSSPPPSSSPAIPPANHTLDGRTHYAECYRTRGHLDCAIEEIERLRQLVAGFTQEDVDLLRCLWSSAQENGNPLSFEESNAADLASRIASTLPPPTP